MAKRAPPPPAAPAKGRAAKTPPTKAELAKAAKAALAAKQPDLFSWTPGKSTAKRPATGGSLPPHPPGKLVVVIDANAEKPRKRARKEKPGAEG